MDERKKRRYTVNKSRKGELNNMKERLYKMLKGELASSVFYIIFGFCLILMPVQMLNVICKVVFGLVLIGAGVYHIYIYVKEKENTTILDLFTGVIVLVLGGFLFFNPPVVVKLFHLLMGAFVLVDSIWTLQGCLKLKKRGRQEWQVLLTGSLVFIVLGFVILLNPFPKVRMTVVFSGWVLLGNGLTDIAFLVLLRKWMQAPPKSDEAEVLDEGPGMPGAHPAIAQMPEDEVADGDWKVIDGENEPVPNAAAEETKPEEAVQQEIEPGQSGQQEAGAEEAKPQEIEPEEAVQQEREPQETGKQKTGEEAEAIPEKAETAASKGIAKEYELSREAEELLKTPVDLSMTEETKEPAPEASSKSFLFDDDEPLEEWKD